MSALRRDSLPGERNPQALPLEGLAHLAIVYLIWGSTFLGIRVAVREGAGFPPFTMGAARLSLAAGGLFLLAFFRGRRLLPTPRELGVMVGAGFLLWGCGNGLVIWAEQRADSSLAALMIGSVPVWVALIDALLDRRAPTAQLLFSLALGFGGVVLLAMPALRSGVEADILSVSALLLGAITWSAGTLLQGRNPVGVSMIVSSAYQHLAGGLWMAILTVVLAEPVAEPTTQAWLAWLYLVVFGGLAFTSYVQVLQLLPVNVAMTHAYVNPVIAVILGWLLLREPITIWTVGGAALILAGVAGVFRERRSRSRGRVAAGVSGK